jgi:hypothetical protein
VVRSPDGGRPLRLGIRAGRLLPGGRASAALRPGQPTAVRWLLGLPLLNSSLAFDTGCVIRTAQVTGPFDRSPLSVPSREVHERSTVGTSQVSRRSAETDAAPDNRLEAGLSAAGRCILQPMCRPVGLDYSI